MTTAFRDSLTTDTQMGLDYAASFTVDPAEAAADAVLRSPEMQQIREALLKSMRITATHVWNAQSNETVLGYLGLPAHVIEWVLS